MFFLSLVAFGLGFILTMISIPVFRKSAARLGLMDSPISSRKVHANPTPVVGGLSIGLVFLFVFGLIFGLNENHSILFLLLAILFGLLLLLGVLDDRFDIPAKQKFVVQIICATVMVKSGISLNSLSDIFGIDFPGWLIQVFTVLVIVGVVNAFNLLDGIDGLSGSFFFYSFTWLLFGGLLVHHNLIVLISFMVMASFLVFLRYNFSKTKKIFMGDGGTLSFGFLIVNLAIYLFEKTNENQVELSLWSMGVIAVLAVPVCDTLIVFGRRINHYNSPFKADRNHLHHLLLNLGFTHLKSTLSILLLGIFTLLISLGFFYLGWKLTSFLVIPGIILINYFVINKLQLFKKSKEIIQNMEKIN